MVCIDHNSVPLNEATGTNVTRVQNLLVESSSSLRFLLNLTRIRTGTFLDKENIINTTRQELSHRTNLMPLAHTCLFNFVSIRTSGVFICFSANFLMALIARGARFLNPLHTKNGMHTCIISTSSNTVSRTPNNASANVLSFISPGEMSKCAPTRIALLPKQYNICVPVLFVPPYMPWTYLCKCIVYSLVTTSFSADFVFFSFGAICTKGTITAL